MAAKTIQGVGGNITMPTGFNSKYNRWQATANFSVVDTTGFSDSGYRTRALTIADISGSATGTALFDDASTSPIAAAVLAATFAPLSAQGSITLTHTTGCTHSFTGVISSVGFDRPIDGKEDTAHTFESSGAITQTWDETA